MPFLEQHGGMYGGGESGKMVKVTASLTEPASPKKYDIWIVTDNYNVIDFLYQTEESTNVGDIKITKSNVTPNIKSSIKGAGKTITYQYVGDSRPKLYESGYFEIFANLGAVFKKTATNPKQTLKAYWYTGTAWEQFSYEETEIVGVEGTNSDVLYAYNYNTGAIRRSTKLNGPVNNMIVNKELKLIYVWVPNTRTFYKMDYTFAILESYSYTSNLGDNLVEVIESKKAMVFIRGWDSTLYIFDYRTGGQIRTWSTSAFNYYSVKWDEKNQRLFCNYSLNGSSGGYLAYNWDAATSVTMLSSMWPTGFAFSKDGNYIYAAGRRSSDNKGIIAKFNRSTLANIYVQEIGGQYFYAPIFVDDKYLYLLGAQSGSSQPAQYNAYRLDDYTAPVWSQEGSYYEANNMKNGQTASKQMALSSNKEIYLAYINSSDGINKFQIFAENKNVTVTAASLGLSTVGRVIFALSGENF
jgi:hypothetical protein